MERVEVVETSSTGWKPVIIAVIRHPLIKNPLRQINGLTAISEVGFVLLIQDLVGRVGIEPT